MLLLWFLPLTTLASSFAYPESRNKLIVVNPVARACEQALESELDRVPDDSQFGLVSSSFELTVPNLLAAYERGIFPWGQSGDHAGEWFSPPARGVLEFNRMHISRSDRKFIRKHLNSGEYTVTFDKAFETVIKRCAEQVRWTVDQLTGQKVLATPWITPLFIQRYLELHRAGHAHSVEVWRNGELVAGLYGVFVRGMFSGESMFHDPERGRDAAKLALFVLIERLRANGHELMDTQMKVGLAEKWGGRYISREDYQRRLKEAQGRALPF